MCTEYTIKFHPPGFNEASLYLLKVPARGPKLTPDAYNVLLRRTSKICLEQKPPSAKLDDSIPVQNRGQKPTEPLAMARANPGCVMSNIKFESRTGGRLFEKKSRREKTIM